MQQAVPWPVGDASPHPPKASIAWAVLPSTSVDINRALRKSGCLTVQKPLVASRLSHLVAALSHDSPPPISSSPEFPPPDRTRLLPSDSHKYTSLDIKIQPVLDTLQEVDEIPPPAIIPDQSTNLPQPSHSPKPSTTNDDVPARLTVLQPAILPVDPEPTPFTKEGKEEPSAPATKSSASSADPVPAPGQGKPTEGKVEEGAAVADSLKPLEGISILLAEDTPIMAKVATILLKKMGAEVVWAADGRLAVEALASVHKHNGREVSQDLLPQEDKQTGLTKFDLILMDCQMPNMDGYEATRIIRKMESRFAIHTPIVSLTAHAMPQDRRKCLDAGMDEYLTKPINVPLLAKTVRSLLQPKTELTQASISQTGEEEKKEDKEEEKEEENKKSTSQHIDSSPRR